MAIHNLLDENVPVYFRFVNNQVLTSSQLNRVLDHINYQDKATRASLIGVGNMCGLEISISDTTVSISEGVAVTSDGDIIKLEATDYNGYNVFSDERVKYDHFLEEEAVIELFELKESSEAANVEPLDTFEAKQSKAFKNMVFILYLECYEKEEEDCSSTECNAQGIEVVYKIRLLMTTIENAKKIAEKDTIFSTTVTDGHTNIAVDKPRIYAKRVVLNNASSSTLSTLKNAYATDFKDISNLLIDLGEISLFKPQKESFPINLPSFFEGLNRTSTNFQYLYDFYKDLITAYNELAGDLNHTYSICCPDPNAFPKHIMRGGLNDATNVYKHKFYASPVHDRDNTISTMIDQFGRILDMIKYFEVSNKDVIDIIPSKDTQYELGERAMPFYYDIQLVLSPQQMINSWRLNKNNLIPNYYRVGYPAGFADPLDYCLDGHDFFRVAGHVGRDVISAVKDITAIRNEKGLGFDIMPIAVGSIANEETLDYDKYSIYFEDLQVILQAWNEEIKCIVSGSSQFLSNFSIAEAGVHLDYVFTKPIAIGDIAAAPEMAPLTEIAAGSDDRIVLGGTNTGKGTVYDVVLGQNKGTRVNNAVDNIVNVEGSTGSLWTGILVEQDNKNDVRVKLEDAVKVQTEAWELPDKVLGIQIPALVLGALKDTEDNKLLDIEDFTEENLALFIDSLQNQCDTAKREKKTLQAEVSREGSLLKDKSYLEQYYFVMNNIISTCCMIERFTVLYEEILKRKQELLNSFVLKEFIKKHPSAEHKAGVKEGGTLIVLYYAKNDTDFTGLANIGNFAFGNVSIGQNVDLQKYVDSRNKLASDAALLQNLEQKMLTDAKTDLAFTEVFKIEETRRFFDPNQFIALPKAESIADGTVIGDLCLPYLCCSGTPATTFVFPDRETDLVVGKSHVCIAEGETVDTIRLTPTPADGTVVAFANGAVIEGAIVPKDDKVFFDPNVVSEADYGEDITFTVDGQNVTPIIKVYQKPQPAFSFTGPVYTNENKRATIRITNTSPFIEGQVFDWDFDVDVFQNGLAEFDFSFDVKPGEEYNYTLKLTATNLSCSEYVELPLEFTVPTGEVEVSLAIEEDTACRLPGVETPLVHLHPTPAEAEIVALINDTPIPEGIKKVEGQNFFNPNAVLPEFFNMPISFTLDGHPVENTFVVSEQPEPSFDVDDAATFALNNTQMTVTIQNTSKVIDGQVFRWNFNGEEVINNAASFDQSFTVLPGEFFNLVTNLQALNNECSAVAQENISEFLVPKVTDGDDNSQLKCHGLRLAEIEALKIRLDEYLELNNSVIPGESQEIYNELMVPLYDVVNNDLAGLLNGAHDTTFNANISAIQSHAAEGYSTQMNPNESEEKYLTVKEWYLRLYLETMLLHFYIRACKGNAINSIPKVNEPWLEFIILAAEGSPENKKLLQGLLVLVPYDALLTDMVLLLDPHLSGPMKELLTNIINTLNSLLA